MDIDNCNEEASEGQTLNGNKNTITIRSLPAISRTSEAQVDNNLNGQIQTQVVPKPNVPVASNIAASTQSISPVNMPVMYTNIQGNLVPIPAPIVQVIVVNQCVKPTSTTNSTAAAVDSNKLTPIAPAPLFIQPLSGEVVSGVERNVEVVRRRSHVCPYQNCEKTYFKSSHLKAHIRTHTGNFLQSFICEISRQFVKSSLKIGTVLVSYLRRKTQLLCNIGISPMK